MRESSFVQAMIEEGAVKARQEDILLMGRLRFGAPAAGTEASLRGITDPDRLTRIVSRILDATSWDDLLATS